MATAPSDNIASRLFRIDAIGIMMALAALCVLLALATDTFLTTLNISTVIRQASFVGIIALGQTLVLLLGGIDLSVGAAAGLSAIIGGLLLTTLGVHPYLVIPLTCLFGFVIGSINGALVAVLGLNPFIVTLASWEIFAGMTLLLTGGSPIRPLGAAFTVFGRGEIWGVPFPVLTFAALAVATSFVLNRTIFGRNIYAIGGNRSAAILMGIPVRRIELTVYGIAGMCAALAGILYASRFDSAQPTVGEGWLMPAITAAIIGGVSLRGGQGTILGTVTGAVLMAVLGNGIILMSVSGFWERVIVGVAVLIAVILDRVRRRQGGGGR